MDAAKLKEAVDFALTRASTWDFEKDQVRTFGTPLGPVPKTRAGTNGIILRHGYIVAEFGDIKANDPVYSVAKSFLSTVAADRSRSRPDQERERSGRQLCQGRRLRLAAQREDHLEAPPAAARASGKACCGARTRTSSAPRHSAAARCGRARSVSPARYYEYNDVRINRFALSLARVFKRGVPDVLKTEIMDKIGASNEWRWIPYDNSTVEIAGKQIGSVSGGTRWGGGIWINSEDLARFGLLALNRGKWGNQQIVSDKWWTEALTPTTTAGAPDYGYLWWLNTKKGTASAPATSYQARGNGSNTIYVDPENDIVFVWHWHQGSMNDVVQRILASIIK